MYRFWNEKTGFFELNPDWKKKPVFNQNEIKNSVLKPVFKF